MSAVSIAEAAEATGWSARMLRYIDRTGLVVPRRTESGYRMYSPGQVHRLESLKHLLTTYDIGLADVVFTLRTRAEPALGAAVDAWLDPTPIRTEDPAGDWLGFEQDKHRRLLEPPTVLEHAVVDTTIKEPV